jgi:hypothetical protein
MRRAAAALLALAAPFAHGDASAPAGAGGAAASGMPERERYDVILHRAPFGAPPPTAGAAAEGGAEAGGTDPAALPAAPEPPPACPVRLRTLSHYSGVPAAGFVEIATGRSFLLREGETLGPYRLLAADVALGEAVLLSGTNSFAVPLSYVAGQATNIVPSAREPFPTVFRADTPTGAAVAVVEESAVADAADSADADVRRPEESPPATPPQKRRAVSASLTPEEEADLVRRATVRGEDGAEHLSFRELQRLRAALLAEKAAAARAAALAEEEERRAAAAARRAAENAARKAAEDEAKAEAAEKERLRRAAVVQALAQGYDVEVDFTLTAEEAQRLRDAGYDVPDAVLEGRATLGGADGDDDGEELE